MSSISPPIVLDNLSVLHRSSFCLTVTEGAPASEPYRAFKRYNFVNNANREGDSIARSRARILN